MYYVVQCDHHEGHACVRSEHTMRHEAEKVVHALATSSVPQNIPGRYTFSIYTEQDLEKWFKQRGIDVQQENLYKTY